MSFLGQAGSGGAAGHLPQLTPGTPNISRVKVNNGNTPDFYTTGGTIMFSPSYKSNTEQGWKIYRASDDALVKTINESTSSATNHITMVAGTSYYAKRWIFDKVINREFLSSATSSITALTVCQALSSVNAYSQPGAVVFNWSDVNFGGDTDVNSTWYYQIVRNGTVIGSGTLPKTERTLTYYDTNTSNAFYAFVRPQNSESTWTSDTANVELGKSSGTVYPQSTGPFFPSFGPFFPFFPFFGGFYKSLFSNTKVRTPNGLVFANQLQVGDELLSVVLPGLSEDGWTPQDIIDWSVDNPMFDLSNTVTTTVVDIVESTTDKIIFINGDAFSGSHRILVKRDNVAKMMAAEDMLETDMIWSATDNQWITISIEVVESPHQIYSINCEPYDVFFTEQMLVHDTRPNIPTE